MNKDTLLSRQLIVLYIIIVALLIWVLFHFIYFSPANVFNRMLRNTLNTVSYTKTIDDYENGQYTKQVVNVETGAINKVQNNETLSVQNDPSGLIKIISIGTPTTDYSTYSEINTLAKSSSGKIINYSSVVGLWGINSPGGTKLTEGQLFNSSVVDVVPIANLNETNQSQLLSYVKKYKIYNYAKKVTHANINGRSVFEYSVSVNIHYLQNYLILFSKDIGLNQYNNQTIPNDVALSDNETVQLNVDLLSGEIEGIKFTGTNRSYVFSSFGASPQISLPKKHISLASLENYIQLLNYK